ncbi:MAG: transglutaminase family protein [Candidatus Competibacteraceae bacterium]
MRRLQIEHTTTYQYRDAVTLLPHKLFLRPREGHDIRLESATLTITPAYQIHWQRDVYSNSVAVVNFTEPSAKLSIISRLLLRNYEDQPLDFLVAEAAVYFPFQYQAAEQIDLGPYLVPIFIQDQPPLNAWRQRFWQPGRVLETYALLDSINTAIARDFRYQPREQPGVQTPATTLLRQTGSCRDFATLFIEACRSLGLAARFVSGYLYSPASRQDQGATHAWSEVYLPGAGWKGFDSTRGQVVGNDHIAVAVSRHPEAVPPVSGAFVAPVPQSPQMEVRVQVVLLG